MNTGPGTASGGALTLLGNTWPAASGGVGAVGPGLSLDGRFPFVNESKIASGGAFAVSDGNLTKQPDSPAPLPAEATPAGLAVS